MEPYRKLDIRVFSTIDSTNNEAKRMLAEQDIDRVLIVSNRQEKGRGRMGRDFYSPEDNGIYMTLIYKVENGIESPMLITMAAAVAVVRAVESLTAVRVGLKWVNDIFVNGKKAGGILTEATTDLETGRVEHVAVGIGLNIHQQDFPEHLQQIAASLNITEVNRNQLIGEITNQLLTLYQAMEPRDFMEEYIAHSIVIGKEVRYEKDKCMVTGQVKEIAENGALIVQNQEGEEDRILSGEILLHN
jgi:BirA family biotin operon repressor/biotin-[acetyl-CoA-carboxylase] ligase